MEYTYQGLVRHSFGFANPNHAAAMFAILIPFFWGIRKVFTGKIIFACVFIPEIILYLALIATISRTGIVSVILGGAFFFYLTCRHSGQGLDRNSLLRTVLIVAGAFIVLLAFGILKRHYAWISSPDDSILNRLILWQGGLQILSDNPSGVGTGLSGMIFTGFYQPPGAGLTFRTMVNSFLTFAVERGVLLSFIVAVPPIFSFIASFISLRCEMSDRMKYIIISLMTSIFCAFISGMASTCFDFSLIAGVFSSRLPDLNSVLQVLLCVIPIGIVAVLILLSFENLQSFHLKQSFLIAVSSSAIIIIVVMITALFINKTRIDICSALTVNGVKWMNISSKANAWDKKALILHDEKISNLRGAINFLTVQYVGYSFEFPFSPVKDIESLFNNYNTVILSGRNVVLANPEVKTMYVFYHPTGFIKMEPDKIVKVYLNPFDEYGSNRQWEKSLAESKDKIKYVSW
jgi:hypothetical protein